MVYPYSGILLSNKTEWTFDTYNMEDSQNSFAEQKKPYRKIQRTELQTISACPIPEVASGDTCWVVSIFPLPVYRWVEIERQREGEKKIDKLDSIKMKNFSMTTYHKVKK